MRATRVGLGALLAACGAALASCTAILGLPDPQVDPTWGTDAWVPRPDGAPPDGGLPDGVAPDAPPDDGAAPDGGCFGGGRTDAGLCRPVQVFVGSGMTADPRILDSDGANVFFVAGNGVIARIDPNVMGSLTILTMGEPTIKAMKVVGASVYFTANAGSGMVNMVSRCSASTGCAGMRTNYSGPNGRRPWGIAVDGTYAYFTFNESAGVDAGGLYRAPIGGGAPTQILAFELPSVLVHDMGTLYWSVESATSPGVYSCSASACSGGGSAMGSDVRDLAVFGQNLYWLEGSAVRWQLMGQVKQIAGGLTTNSASAIRTDGTHVYWITEKALQRCPVGTDCQMQPLKLETLASGFMQGAGLVVTADSVFYATRGDSTIWRVGKQ